MVGVFAWQSLLTGADIGTSLNASPAIIRYLQPATLLNIQTWRFRSNVNHTFSVAYTTPWSLFSLILLKAKRFQLLRIYLDVLVFGILEAFDKVRLFPRQSGTEAHISGKQIYVIACI
jgi:uncharacterized membrane protein